MNSKDKKQLLSLLKEYKVDIFSKMDIDQIIKDNKDQKLQDMFGEYQATVQNELQDYLRYNLPSTYDEVRDFEQKLEQILQMSRELKSYLLDNYRGF